MGEPTADPAIVEVIPLVEETLRIDKRTVISGRVRIATATDIETQLVQQTLRGEHATIERVRVDRELVPGEVAPVVRHEPDGTMIIPVVEEVLVVETRLVLREEIRVRITSALEEVEESVTLRRQRVVVERLPGDAQAAKPHGEDP